MLLLLEVYIIISDLYDFPSDNSCQLSSPFNMFLYISSS